LLTNYSSAEKVGIRLFAKDFE